jgi:hypothetical protein
VEGETRERTHEWHFRIGEAFPADDPLARFILAVARMMDDGVLVNSRIVEAEQDYELLYFFVLASSHLYEAAETLRKAHTEWNEVREFVASLDEVRRAEFEHVTALDSTAWPGNRLKEMRNTFFHYLRLDRAAANAGELPLQSGLAKAAEVDGSIIIEAGGPLNGIRALFADEVFVKTLTADYEDDELERLIAALPDYQGDLNRFAQAAVGRYLSNLPAGVLAEGAAEPPE